MTTARLGLAPIARIEWRRPMIMDVTPLNRPTAEQAAARQALAITTIGSVDVDQTERDHLRRQRDYNERKRKRKAKQEEEMQTETAPNLKPKERKVLARIDGAEIAVPDLIRRVASLKE